MMVSAAAAFIIFLLLWVARQWRTARISRLGCLPPGPRAWPVIGHLHLLAGGAPHLSLAKLAQTYGPLLYLRLGSMPTVVVSSPELAREFLCTHDRIFASRPELGCASMMRGGQDAGIVLARYGPAWSDARRICHAQLFAASRVKAVALPIIMEEIQRMLADVHQYAIAGLAYNIAKGTSLLLENITCRLLLGQTLGSASCLKEKVQEAVAVFSRPMVGDYIPWLGFLDVLHKRRVGALIASLHALLDDVVATRHPSPQCPKVLLDSLILDQRDPDNIKHILVDLISNGVGTTAATLDWAMAELLLHPTTMRKLEEELNMVVGSKPPSLMVEADHLPDLGYTKAVVKETLRLHTPAPLLVPHMSTEVCEVAGYTLPKGTMLFVNVWAIARDPKIWPDRPVEFIPDRYINQLLADACHQVVDVGGQNFELLPFGSGRRICPGLPLVLPIVEMTLANLVHSFHWSLPPPPHHTVDMSTKLGQILCRASPDLLALPSVRM